MSKEIRRFEVEGGDPYHCEVAVRSDAGEYIMYADFVAFCEARGIEYKSAVATDE